MFAKNYLMLNFNPNFLKKIDLSHYNLDVNSFYIYMDNVWEDGISGNKIRKLFGNLEEAKKVAEFLKLPFFTFDYREEYEKRIVEYIYREYALGRTPNPDVFCNNLIKFDLFLEEALSL
jgi:tRNA-specific 2-thiouridylase